MISGPAYPLTARLQSQAAAFTYRPRLAFVTPHFAEPEEADAEPSASAFSSSMLARGGVASPGPEESSAASA